MLKKNMGPEDFHAVIRKQWGEMDLNKTGVKMEELLAQTALIDGMAQDDHSLFMIFDTANFEISYLGKNIEAFCGYTEEDFSKQRMKFVFKIFRLGQLGFFLKFVSFSNYFIHKVPQKEKEEDCSFSFCGLSIRHKQGHFIKTLIRAYPLVLCEDGSIGIALLKVKNITNLLKSDDYWIRYAFGDAKTHKLCYFSAGLGRTVKHDLITPRELEILRFIADGVSTDEIAKRLFLSPATVEKHRKNMIARLGARDSVALTEIAMRAGIL